MIKFTGLLKTSTLTLVFISFSGILSGATNPDVARLSFIAGAVSFKPVGQNVWVKATVNRPLIIGDRLWADFPAVAELQLSASIVHVDHRTSLKILNLTNTITQFQLSLGSIIVYVRDFKDNHIYEIDTPNLAFLIRTKGVYRIDIDDKGETTITSVHSGLAEVYGLNKALQLTKGLSCQFSGKNLSPHRCFKMIKPDDFDKWSQQRNIRIQPSISIKYISNYMIGYEDLDSYGTWLNTNQYGYAWFPRDVKEDWAPYSQGHWIWLRHWGWTWVDEEPWGFAPFHYGRWAFIEDKWGWVPGPREVEPIFAPAVVGFFESQDNYVGWFPLGPGEIYVPAWRHDLNYLTQINISNTQINQLNIINYYKNRKAPRSYQNFKNFRGISRVPKNVFLESMPVHFSQPAKGALPSLEQSPIVATPALAPTNKSLFGSKSTKVSSPLVKEKGIVVKTPPPPAAVPFNKEKNLLDSQPGMPLSVQETEKLQATIPVESKIEFAKPQKTLTPIDTNKIEESTTLPEILKQNTKGMDSQTPGEEAKPKAIQQVQPEENKTQKVQPELLQPQDIKPEQPKPEAAQPEQLQPQDSKPEQPKPEAAQPEQLQPQDIKPEQPMPEAAQPEQFQLQDSKPEQPMPEAAQPEQFQPQDSKPEQPQPQEAQPEQLQPQDSKSEQPMPEAAQPEQFQPQDSKTKQPNLE